MTEEELKQGQIDACTIRLMTNGVLVTEVPFLFAASPARIIRRMIIGANKNTNKQPWGCACCICEYEIILPQCSPQIQGQLSRALGALSNFDNYRYTVHAHTWAEAFAMALYEARRSLARAMSIVTQGRVPLE